MKKQGKKAPKGKTPNIYQNNAGQDDTSRDREDYKEQQAEDTSAPSDGNKAALYDAIIGSATDNVRSHTHHHDTLGNTGTNISYEGPTAPGSGGSAGTGYASGQDAVGARTSTNSEYEEGRVAHPKKKDDDDEQQEEVSSE
jgi:hypothetical protein